MQFLSIIDELKRLCRSWKLNDERNFWKLNPNTESLVAALIQHINDKGKTLVKNPRNDTTSVGNLNSNNNNSNEPESSFTLSASTIGKSKINNKMKTNEDKLKLSNIYGKNVSKCNKYKIQLYYTC